MYFASRDLKGLFNQALLFSMQLLGWTYKQPLSIASLWTESVLLLGSEIEVVAMLCVETHPLRTNTHRHPHAKRQKWYKGFWSQTHFCLYQLSQTLEPRFDILMDLSYYDNFSSVLLNVFISTIWGIHICSLKAWSLKGLSFPLSSFWRKFCLGLSV